MAEIRLRSPAFGDHEAIPTGYAHEAGDLSPPLEWEGVPEKAAELALVCSDPDAPAGTFTHWLVAGIAPGAGALAAGELPAGARTGTNDYGFDGYGGPHPLTGEPSHRYVFRLFACRRRLQLTSGFSAQELRRELSDNVVGTTALVGVFGR